MEDPAHERWDRDTEEWPGLEASFDCWHVPVRAERFAVQSKAGVLSARLSDALLGDRTAVYELRQENIELRQQLQLLLSKPRVVEARDEVEVTTASDEIIRKLLSDLRTRTAQVLTGPVDVQLVRPFGPQDDKILRFAVEFTGTPENRRDLRRLIGEFVATADVPVIVRSVPV